MRILAIATLILISAAPTAAYAQTAPAAPAAAETGYSVETTEIGTLLDDPAARAVLDKYLPGLSTNEQIDMARSMTLKSVQPYKPEVLTDEALANVQAALGKLPPKK